MKQGHVGAREMGTWSLLISAPLGLGPKLNKCFFISTVAPLPHRDMLRDLQRMPETADSTRLYIYCVTGLFLYIHTCNYM